MCNHITVRMFSQLQEISPRRHARVNSLLHPAIAFSEERIENLFFCAVAPTAAPITPLLVSFCVPQLRDLTLTRYTNATYCSFDFLSPICASFEFSSTNTVGPSTQSHHLGDACSVFQSECVHKKFQQDLHTPRIGTCNTCLALFFRIIQDGYVATSTGARTSGREGGRGGTLDFFSFSTLARNN